MSGKEFLPVNLRVMRYHLINRGSVFVIMWMFERLAEISIFISFNVFTKPLFRNRYNNCDGHKKRQNNVKQFLVSILQWRNCKYYHGYSSRFIKKMFSSNTHLLHQSIAIHYFFFLSLGSLVSSAQFFPEAPFKSSSHCFSGFSTFLLVILCLQIAIFMCPWLNEPSHCHSLYNVCYTNLSRKYSLRILSRRTVPARLSLHRSLTCWEFIRALFVFVIVSWPFVATERIHLLYTFWDKIKSDFL